MGKKKLQIKITRLDEREIDFDLINSEFPFANAIRRILLAEVPTMAIEKIHLYRNTTELPDFALCQRLGLIPIKADASEFEMKNSSEDEATDRNTIRLSLDVQCPINNNGENLHVYSDSIKWQPIGDQTTRFESEPIRPVDMDILLMKLAPSQQIDAQMECHKGIGKDHAKYCPVAACFYRFVTEFHFDHDKQLEHGELEILKTFFPPGYLDFNDIDKTNGFPCIINNRFNRSDFTMQSWDNHQCLRKKIQFETKTNTLAFTIESIGAIDPSELVIQSIDILKSKCTKFIKHIKRNK
ncbi:dna-directed rna polymerases i and iii subunit rpac1-like [Dermatophagoides farinae]|uniref:Dna-directed rna polymerases i and iii subunit rpac1-like n=1 Tax=Dermatophagoides farinae TaxID=6954 RepID=A0A9D4SJF4_DERFA|nr:DNA-directed RNA polymerases I and III subunit RPAC1-like [Dermatophagoides farinae]KAH7643345.1 dna-directed rna polymerases i and iii subunit rpac1-like [Dermatophagoides farinae]